MVFAGGFELSLSLGGAFVVVDGVEATVWVLFVEGVCEAGFLAGVAVPADLFCGGSFLDAVVLVVEAEVVLLSLGGPPVAGCFADADAGFFAAIGLGAPFVEGICFGGGFDGVVVVGLTGFAAAGRADVVGFFVGVGLLPGAVVVCVLAGPMAAGFFAVAAF